MALDGERQLLGRDAAAVVRDLDQPEAALADGHADAGRARVERVLEQFLDHRDRPLDRLAGGDLSDGVGVEQVDGHRSRHAPGR